MKIEDSQIILNYLDNDPDWIKFKGSLYSHKITSEGLGLIVLNNILTFSTYHEDIYSWELKDLKDLKNKVKIIKELFKAI